MLECIFTIDYEIYGNGQGSLRELVYEPARRLKTIFDRAGARFVVFVEAAELQKIDQAGSDPAIDEVKNQILHFYKDGYEIALHLHPQWSNASFANGQWELDYSEYNLCLLRRERIQEIVGGAVDYLRGVLEDSAFKPLSFRAGNWLFQPTRQVAEVLGENGVLIDSSVFKGGRIRSHRLDYRGAAKNGPYWNFKDDVGQSDPNGQLLEIPIHTQMVPFWKLATGKRLGLQAKAPTASVRKSGRLASVFDRLRFRQPLKFDFCRMTLKELTTMLDQALRDDARSKDRLEPLVAIGHTKDLDDLATVEQFLSFLQREGVGISTFQQIYPRLALYSEAGSTAKNGFTARSQEHETFALSDPNS